MGPQTGQMWRFVQCAEAFGWTYDQFLDTPDHVVEYALRLHRLREQSQNRTAPGAGAPPAPFGAPAGM